ncbi:MAG TPA: pyridoxal phosphate-dependent aminotransferase [Candidatus Dormibacteraeota bacterium]|nr:pyridoxal phosphate-dependent aminotransferase [Candidatus Dormibacteraeota bacterium]
MSEIRFAERMDGLGTEGAFEVLAKARALEAQGRDIVHLEIGEPDFPTPANIVEAAHSAMQHGATHYTPAGGLIEARAATARYVAKWTGAAEPDPMQVVLVPGSKNVLHFALLSLVEPGDEVIYPDPGYPIYHSLTQFVGARPVALPIRESNDFRVDVEELRSLVTDRTRLLIVNTPGNPTGGALTRADMEAIAELAQERDLYVLSDEIYGRLVYDGEHVSMYSIPGMQERTILMDGLSKAWAMCGWRLGWGVMPQELARRFEKLMINTSSCAAAFTQMAAIEAFEAPESDRSVEVMRAEFRRRRDLLVEGLNRIPGVRCHRPAGAFYVFPNVEETGWDERSLADSLLTEAGVACLWGTAFGPYGAGHLRFSYANSVDNLRLALQRFEAHLAATPAPVRV